VQGDSLKTLPPSTFVVNQRNRKIRTSALVRYLYYNSNLNLGGQGNVQKAVQDSEAEAAGAAQDENREYLSRAVTETLGEIRALVPGTPVLFVFDADRNALYASGKKPLRLRNSPLLQNACPDFGYRFLDLTEALSGRYLKEGKPFNFPDNYHWNPYGVEVVAQAIMAELESLGWFQDGRLQIASARGKP
jgi:hypothetical protein